MAIMAAKAMLPKPAGGATAASGLLESAADDQIKAMASSIWLDAYSDPLADLRAFSECMVLADLNGDGDSKLVVADKTKRLKVFKGTNLVHDKFLLDQPVAMCSYFMDYGLPRRPAVAVAAGPHIFLYRNLEPYFKFTVPADGYDSAEIDLWNQWNALQHSAQAQSTDISSFLLSHVADWVARLDALRSSRPDLILSQRSIDLLRLVSSTERLEYIQRTSSVSSGAGTTFSGPFGAPNSITCMEVLMKDKEEGDGLGCLVIGTEHRQVFILDPSGIKVMRTIRVPETPAFLCCHGAFDVDYRIFVACRNGTVYTIKQGELVGAGLELGSQPCAMLRTGKSLVVATMDKVVHSFQPKGKKAYSLYLPASVTDMDLLHFGMLKNTKALIIALDNGEVRVYVDQQLTSVTRMAEPINALRYGRYGREDSCLVLIGKSGTFYVKILPRRAQLDSRQTGAAAGPGTGRSASGGSTAATSSLGEADAPLALPKKTKLYLEQCDRERQFATDMHRIFQKDLCRLRLSTVRSYAKMVTDGQGPVSYVAGSNVRMNAKVQGLGPLFRLRVEVINSGTEAVYNIPLLFSYPQHIYRLRVPSLCFPSLVPSLKYVKFIDVDCLNPGAGSDAIRAVLMNPASQMPFLTVLINMPPSEQPI